MAEMKLLLVIHEAPSSHRHGFEALELLAKDLGVRMVIQDHHHEDYRSTIYYGMIEVIGVGLLSIFSSEGVWIIQSRGY